MRTKRQTFVAQLAILLLIGLSLGACGDDDNTNNGTSNNGTANNDASNNDASNNDTSNNDASDGGDPATDDSFAVTVDGEVLDLPNVSVMEPAEGVVTINAASQDNGSLFTINLANPEATTYTCGALTSMSYATDQHSTTYNSGTCEIEITTADDGHIAGTFSGELENAENSETITVTDGSFDIEY